MNSSYTERKKSNKMNTYVMFNLYKIMTNVNDYIIMKINSQLLSGEKEKGYGRRMSTGYESHYRHNHDLDFSNGFAGMCVYVCMYA